MGIVSTLGRAWLRLYQTDGVPASGVNQPSKTEGQAVFDAIDAAISDVEGAGGGAYGFVTLTALNAFVPPGGAAADNALARLSGDPGGPSVDGFYVYDYGTSSWSRQSSLGFFGDSTNSAAGEGAMATVGTGDTNNTAFGVDALAAFSDDDGAAFGYRALFQATGYRNTALGSGAGSSIITGTLNTFVGYGAGNNVSQLANANNSTAIGNLAYTTADGQIALGDDTCDQIRLAGVIMVRSFNPTLYRNYFFGNAGNSSLSGGANVGIGDNTMVLMSTGTHNVAIGDFAMPAAGTGSVAIGSHAMYSSSTALDCVMIGYEAGMLGVSGVGSTGIGRRALAHETVFSNNTGIGDSALWLCTGGGNFAGGYRVNEYGTTVAESVFIGNGAAANRQTGSFNVIIGSSAGDFPGVTPNTTTGVGAQAAGDRNIGIGYQAIRNYTGNDVTAVGNGALSANTTGTANSAFGSLTGVSITTGTLNVHVGYKAGNHVSQLATASNSMALGANTYNDASNQIVLGDANVTQTILRGALRCTTFTVATLPSAATMGAGARSFVTDANATTFASTVAGGGANNVPVYSDGTNWKIG